MTKTLRTRRAPRPRKPRRASTKRLVQQRNWQCPFCGNGDNDPAVAGPACGGGMNCVRCGSSLAVDSRNSAFDDFVIVGVGNGAQIY